LSILSVFAQNDSITVPTEKMNFLEGVVITGTLTPRALKNTTVLTKVISSNDIKEAGVTSVLEALETFLPGVNFTPNVMGDNIQVAGLDNKYILILVDGERMVNERTENVNFSRLNSADIERIEIINGAASVLYGSNAIGAVINIITKEVKKKVTGSLRLRYANYNTLNTDASFGFNYKGFSGKTLLSAKNSDGYSIVSKPNKNGETVSLTMNPFSDYTVAQSFMYKNKGWEAELKGTYYQNKTWFLQKYQVRKDQNYTIKGRLQYTFPKKNVLTLTANSDIYDGHQIYKLRNDSSVYVNGSMYTTVRLVDAWDITRKIQLVSGTEFNIENTFSYNQFGETPVRKEAFNGNLFAQAEFRSEIGLDALVGVRYTQHSQFGGYLSPKISLMYHWKSLRFRGTISNGYKAPTLKELYMDFPHKIGDDIPFWIIGNKDLTPEESWYKSISAEYTISKLDLTITAYDNSIRNKINTNQVWNAALVRTEMRYENVENAQITGVDFTAQWNFLKYFNLRAGYSFANAIDKASKQQLSGNSKHTATLSLVFKHKHLPYLSKSKTPYSFMLSSRIMSPRIFYSTNSVNGAVTEESTGTFGIVNFVYNQQFPIYKDLCGDFQFGINNLFNYVNRDYVTNNPGRIFFVSLGIQF
jgi:outer membrane receptor for ferrienterochelin and colicins